MRYRSLSIMHVELDRISFTQVREFERDLQKDASKLSGIAITRAVAPLIDFTCPEKTRSLSLEPFHRWRILRRSWLFTARLFA